MSHGLVEVCRQYPELRVIVDQFLQLRHPRLDIRTGTEVGLQIAIRSGDEKTALAGFGIRQIEQEHLGLVFTRTLGGIGVDGALEEQKVPQNRPGRGTDAGQDQSRSQLKSKRDGNWGPPPRVSPPMIAPLTQSSYSAANFLCFCAPILPDRH